jgi:hypothetical protein
MLGGTGTKHGGKPKGGILTFVPRVGEFSMGSGCIWLTTGLEGNRYDFSETSSL